MSADPSFRRLEEEEEGRKVSTSPESCWARLCKKVMRFAVSIALKLIVLGLFLGIVILLASPVDALSHALVDGLELALGKSHALVDGKVLALGIFVLTFPITTAVGFGVRIMIDLHPKLDKTASLIPINFSPNWFAFSRVCGSLLEDLGSITLVNDANHSVVWLYFLFTIFPVAEAVLEELAECWDCKMGGVQLDDLALGVVMEALQAVLFMYFADYSPEAVAFFGLMFAYQTATVIGKVLTKEPTPLEGNTTREKMSKFVEKYRVALGAMFAFALVQFALALVGVELSGEVQAVCAAIPWAIGLAMELELPAIKELRLNSRGIDDEQLIQLVKEASANGALPLLRKLYLHKNAIGDAGVTALAGAIASGALPSLTRLSLGGNEIGDEGMQAFAAAVGSGALPRLEYLFLSQNAIGDAGMSALAEAVRSGALPKLRSVSASSNPGNGAPLKEACGARRITCFV